jgi:MarR family transcriptional regulator for hemolysin
MELQKHFSTILHETARAWRLEIDRRLKSFGLSQAKWRTLLFLDLASEKLSQRQLASRLGVEDPTLVRLLDRLAKDGWIVRQDDPADRRSKIVQLTSKSHKTLRHIHAAADQVRKEFLSGIPARELKTCIEVLEKIKAKAGVQE